jgi:NAD(P)-dependent dehydrogenase (short-subunit alcohol dehydrogenase family)
MLKYHWGDWGRLVMILSSFFLSFSSFSRRIDKGIVLTTIFLPFFLIVQPAEAATSYIFLASQESSYMTGQVLHPNGGMWTSS